MIAESGKGLEMLDIKVGIGAYSLLFIIDVQTSFWNQRWQIGANECSIVTFLNKMFIFGSFNIYYRGSQSKSPPPAEPGLLNT